MKKLLLALVILINGSVVLAQAPETPKGHSRIIGAVVDADSNQPVEFANIVLNNPDTEKPVDGTVCDDKGKFTINKVAPGTYDVVITFIGYETQTIAGITVGDKREDLNIGLIKLS